MFLKDLNDKINAFNEKLERINLIDLLTIAGSKREIFKRNLLAGIARGIGITIGITIVTAIAIYALQRIVNLNIPLIGEYIIQIIEIIEAR